MRILYVGQLAEGRTSYQRMVALKELGHEVRGINTFIHKQSLVQRYYSGLFHRLGYTLDIKCTNQTIEKEIAQSDYNVLWLDKSVMVKPKTLSNVKAHSPQCAIIFYSPDDMMNPMNQSRYYLSSLPLYDVHFTTKSFNVEELKALGCKRAIFEYSAYDLHIHRPFTLTQDELKRWQADVGFIGGYELDRFQKMLTLAENSVPVKIIGSFWDRVPNRHHNLNVVHGDLTGQDYSKAICATKINLSFLRKANRDLHTTRSVEIPACGGFMLAERTDEHLELFHEGKEAEFFDSDDELLDKVNYYINHEKQRKAIAEAGRRRCLESGYSNHDRMKFMLENYEYCKQSKKQIYH